MVNEGDDVAFDADEYTRWDYNDRSELTVSHRYEGDDPDDYATDPKVEGEYFDFAYDPIGNRKTHSVGFTTPVESTYTAGELNQYRIIGTELPEVAPLLFHDADGNLIGTADLIPADMNCDGVVDFSDIDPFVLALSGCGGYDEQYPYCDCLNADIDGDGDVDFDDLNLFVAQMGENGYRQVFTWDAENRLTSVGPHAGNTETGDIKVEFTYDYMSRRVEKLVTAWDPNAQAWESTPETHTKYVWDGWKLLMELEENAQQEDDVMRKYTWGLDLAGQNGSINSLQGAGTIGGLLAVHDVDDPADPADPFGDFVYTYDANGNVGQVVDLSATSAETSIKVKYEYGPYGSRVNAPDTGEYEQPFRFSTKQWDDETGLGYWGERYYNPTLGRWMSRDPIGEWDGPNIHGYVGNAPTNSFDPFGLAAYHESGSGSGMLMCSGVEYASMLPPSGELSEDPPPSSGEEDSFLGWNVCCSQVSVVTHCELVMGPCPSGTTSQGEVWRDNSANRHLDDGTPCSEATDEDVADCISRQRGTGWRPFGSGNGMSECWGGQYGNNCQTGTVLQVGQCCLSSNWDPAWYALDGNEQSFCVRGHYEPTFDPDPLAPGGSRVWVCDERVELPDWQD